MIYIKFPKKISDKVVDKAEQRIKKTAADVKNKISETVSNVAAEISAIEEERKRKNLETMNRIRFNANHLSDSELRKLINDNSIDKFKRIGYAAAFADRHSDRNGDKK